eukprot:12817082-Alexandrium_andersonii.AAC.1
MSPATKLNLPRSDRARRFNMKPRRTMSATPLRISWSFFSGIATRTPSEHISKHAPIHATEDPEVVLRHARGYPAS